MRTLKAHQQFGAYELERKLGVGGMAEVWLAHPLTRGHRYARVVIKRIHAHLADDPKLAALFLDELQIVQRLEHANVVRVFDGGVEDDDYFMAMEYIDGLDLRSCVDAHGGPLWPALAAAIVAQACVGLHYAHTLKGLTGRPLALVHRDISPDNLMVDRQGVVKVVDFGIARAETNQATTSTGMRKGKVRYMAPEYLLEGLGSAASDVYALGATLWELCTGRRPFEEFLGPALTHAVVSRSLPRADTVRPSLPAELVEILAQATAHKVSQRLKTAADFERALRGFLELYRPPSAAEIGAEVSVWKAKLDAGAARRARAAGTFGQLESTEAFVRAVDEPPPRSPTGGPPSVQVPHQLDLTQFEVSVPIDDTTDRDVRFSPPADSGPSVILDPELERAAQRSPAAATRKKKKPRRR